MNYGMMYKQLSPLKRGLFRKFMAEQQINPWTWRKWLQRNRIPEKMREAQVRVFFKKLNKMSL
jgi:hypothetical protein